MKQRRRKHFTASTNGREANWSPIDPSSVCEGWRREAGHILNNFLIDVRRSRVLPKGAGDLKFSQATEAPSVSPFGFTHVALKVGRNWSCITKVSILNSSTCTKNKNRVQVDLSWSNADQSGPCEEKEAEPQPRGLAAEAAEVKGQKRSLCALQTGRWFLQQL